MNKVDEITIAINELSRNAREIDVMCFCETFIQMKSESLLRIPGYKLANSYCRNNKRGGTCILIKNEMTCTKLDNLINDIACNFNFECSGIELTIQQIIVICVYRTPNSNPKVFLEKLETLLNRVTKKAKKVILCGDWNLDTIKPTKSCQELLGLLKNFNIELHIRTPTRKQSCLDLFASNIKQAKGEVHHLALSDHETGQTLSIPTKIHKPIQSWFEHRRDYHEENIQRFSDCMSALSFSDMYLKDNLEDAFREFHSTVRLFYDLCFPVQKIKRSNKTNNTLWLTKGIRKSCVRKRYMHLKTIHSKSHKDKVTRKYKKYSVILKHCINKSQQINNKRYIENGKNKCKATWDIINKKIGDIQHNHDVTQIVLDNNKIIDPQNICETFNEYYINLTNNNEFNYKNDALNRYMDMDNNNTIFLNPSDTIEVFRIIQNLKNTPAVGYDELNTKVIKACASQLCKPLSHLINMSFTEGIFPSELKRSIVKPIYKNGDKSDVANYRPITLIPILSKIFEKIMLKRLNEYVDKYNLLRQEQFGFRKNSTTSLACFNLIKIVTQAMNDNIPVVAIFLDMSKAFDFVDHKLLLSKLEKYGIRGQANDWVKSYLSDRHQCVQISKVIDGNKIDFKSKYKMNAVGVPQGSVMGSFLFLLYINDLPNATHHETILFADDTTLIIKCNDKYKLEEEINDAIRNIISWLEQNNLKININKTKLIQFQTYKSNFKNLDIKYGDSTIAQVEQTKFLGITVDQNCNWKAHINDVCDKVDKFVYAIKRIRATVSVDAAVTAYHGYVSSVLSYGIILWGNSTEMIRAFRVQKKCVRAISGVWFLDSCRPLFKKLRILPLPCIYIRELCMLVKQNPHYFRMQSEVTNKRAAPRNKYKYELNIPHCKLQLFRKNVYITAMQVYNKLPNAFKELPMNMFKKKLTNWLLCNCFYDINEFMDFCKKLT